MVAKRPYAPIRASMAGQVAMISAQTGDIVEEGESVVSVEAMKLMLDCEAPMRGEIEIMVSPHEMVVEDQVVAKIYPA